MTEHNTIDFTAVGKWDRWYHGLQRHEPQLYGDDITYRLGAKWLRGSNLVYDLGCGKGGFKHVFDDEARAWPSLEQVPVLGVDGSKTPFADIHADLTDFTVELGYFAEGFKVSVFMRHVIEHDYRWRDILENAVASFNHRMVLVLFTPTQPETHEIAWNEDPGVPDIGFSVPELVTLFAQHGVIGDVGTYRTNTQYGEETIFLLSKIAGVDAPA